ncbi:hypothetical protein BJV74DRAFT_887447 [Russula compacta]|nr:hypothetical protein BJV74DRAFT_887447 [Russula compacta]
MLDIWPALPIVITGRGNPASLAEGIGNIIAALEHNDRLRQIDLSCVPNSLLQRLAVVMQGPFPALRSLVLRSKDESVPVISDKFLDRSAPRLQTLTLDGIPFPALRKLHSSASNLVQLDLLRIPSSGYISPEAMVTCLSAMTKLESLRLEFRSPRSRPGRTSQRPPPLTYAVLPSLTRFCFKGVSEYLEVMMAQIDAPLLHDFRITFFNQLIFNTSQLHQFISRTEALRALDKVEVAFFTSLAVVTLSSRTGGPRTLSLKILSTHPDWQLSSLAQVCSSSLPPFLTLECLDIRNYRYWKDDTENAQWLELFHPFTAVTNLYLDKGLVPRVAPVLQDLVGESAAETLPALQNLFLRGFKFKASGPVQDAIQQFIAARRLTGQHVTVNRKKRVNVESGR